MTDQEHIEMKLQENMAKNTEKSYLILLLSACILVLLFLLVGNTQNNKTQNEPTIITKYTTVGPN